MNKYLIIILAVAAAIMTTSCSSSFSYRDAQKAAARMKQETPAMKIESETEPSSQPAAAMTEGTTQESGDSGKDTEITKLNKVMYTTSKVHVRAAASTDSKALGLLGKGSSVTVTGLSGDGWMRIDYKDKEGFVSKAYLTDTKPEDEAAGKKPAASGSGEGGKKNASSAKKPTAGAATKAPAETEKAGTGSGASAGASESLSGETGESIPVVESSPFTSRPAGSQDNGGPGTVEGPGSIKGGNAKPEHEIGPGV